MTKVKIIFTAAFIALSCAVFAPCACAQAEGPRKVTCDERNIYVNGKLFFVKGVAYCLDYGPKQLYSEIPPAVIDNDFKMMKEAGINTVRTYAPLPVEVLDLAHKHGLMVIENVCYPSGLTNYNAPGDLQKLKIEALQYVKRDTNHPAIVMWSIWNDMPFTWGKGGNILNRFDPDIVHNFLQEIYAAIKEVDANHPITGSNIMEKVGEETGFDFLDVLGVNAYLGISDWFNGKFDIQYAKSQVGKIERITSLKYKKPGIIMETGYSTYCKRHDQGRVITAQIQSMGTSLAGVVIFQWSDGWNKAGNPEVHDEHIEEHWGIVDGFRKPKPGYTAVSQAFGMIPTESRGFRGMARF